MIPTLYQFSATAKLYYMRNIVELPIMGLFQMMGTDGMDISQKIQDALKSKFGGIVVVKNLEIKESGCDQVLKKLVESFPLDVSHAWKVKEVKTVSERQDINQDKIWICIGL